MPRYPHITRYRDDLQRTIEFGGSDNEQSIRRAFANCLDAYCRDHKEGLALVDELDADARNRPDGTVKDSLRMARGYWEAKDTHDDLDAEIVKKTERGYPTDNIIYEDSRTAVLIQDGHEHMRVDMMRNGELHRLIRRFLDYELPQIEEFRKAQRQFKDDLPSVLAALREAISIAEVENAEYRTAAADFLALCQRTISPDVSDDDIREMLLQHILTQDIFLRVFAETQFHQENDIARRLTAVEQTFFTGNIRRAAIDRLRAYYGVIGRAADEIADYSEKQQFLKAIYEDFYKAYNPAAADRLGVVYTSNEIVDFIIRGVDSLLEKHFARTLSDDNVQILDPATGTGTFVTNLIKHLPIDRLAYKYEREIHANEISILPYYIANLNIEYTYREQTGTYREFPNLCFVDTLDNLDWQGAADASGAVSRQGGMDLGALSVENLARIQHQNGQTISVIIGNPPYNDSQSNWNEFNPNRAYPHIDQRIRDTYVHESAAQKTHQYDMYKRFIRWASDRLADAGVIALITNRAYLDSFQDDGFRKTMTNEFSDIYIVDLGGNMQSAGRAGNVFGIRIGVAIGFFVRSGASGQQGTVQYHALEDEQAAPDKLRELDRLRWPDIPFRALSSKPSGDWLGSTAEGWEQMIPLASRQTKYTATAGQEQALFKLVCPGVKTNRDEWVHDFSISNLRAKALYFCDVYDDLLDDLSSGLQPTIKWSADLRKKYQQGQRAIFADNERALLMWRPFVKKHYYGSQVMSDRLTKHHYAIHGSDLREPNSIICIKGPTANHFAALASALPVNEKFAGTNDGGTFCLPLYRYGQDGVPITNLTEWGIQQFTDAYGERLDAEHIFAYVYAVLHDQEYRAKYERELLREYPRVPLYGDFEDWAEIGQQLLDLHVGFESIDPFELRREEREVEDPIPRLKADKDAGEIAIDSATTLAGVPVEAWSYEISGRSALEWVLDQYKEKKPRDPVIRERFDAYRLADHKEQVIDLLRRVCTVSVETMQLIDSMSDLDRGAPQP